MMLEVEDPERDWEAETATEDRAAASRGLATVGAEATATGAATSRRI